MRRNENVCLRLEPTCVKHIYLFQVSQPDLVPADFSIGQARDSKIDRYPIFVTA